MTSEPTGLRVWTVGHSSRDPGAFIALLAEAGVTRVVDIRTIPRSRHVPWADLDTLPKLLGAHGLLYSHLPALGGRRRPRTAPEDSAWRNEGFRGYADHMRTEEFARGLAALLEVAEREHAAIMCAEAVPWRCHRSLVADALLARGVEVLHIMDDGVKPARMTAFAKVRDGLPTYPPEGGRQSRLPG
ncbi:MAG TPA: DUF488 domain-containing protein [Candidatus Thermoplasmatota archaeon]|nr:DUF488 domain-containing protein [Candidatus Thermoplasmatota archaeon]